VLMDRFKVNLQDIGKSLSMFTDALPHLRAGLPVPFELITTSKILFAVLCLGTIEVDKPVFEILSTTQDLRKTDHIRALMGNQKISISVAIKEDG